MACANIWFAMIFAYIFFACNHLGNCTKNLGTWRKKTPEKQIESNETQTNPLQIPKPKHITTLPQPRPSYLFLCVWIGLNLLAGLFYDADYHQSLFSDGLYSCWRLSSFPHALSQSLLWSHMGLSKTIFSFCDLVLAVGLQQALACASSNWGFQPKHFTGQSVLTRWISPVIDKYVC